MKLNHVNLAVEDIDASAAFFVRNFDFRIVASPDRLRVLEGTDGFTLTLFATPDGAPAKYPGIFHIGFVLPDEAAVDAVYTRLKENGEDVPKPPRHHHWAYHFYATAPGPFLYEITCHSFQKGDEEDRAAGADPEPAIA